MVASSLNQGLKIKDTMQMAVEVLNSRVILVEFCEILPKFFIKAKKMKNLMKENKELVVFSVATNL